MASTLRSLRLAAQQSAAPCSNLIRTQTGGAQAQITRYRSIAVSHSKQQLRCMSSEKKDDLGGPGGQEPVDPVVRGKQNAGYRNQTILGLLLVGVPLFYMVGKPDIVAEAQADPRAAVHGK